MGLITVRGVDRGDVCAFKKLWGLDRSRHARQRQPVREQLRLKLVDALVASREIDADSVKHLVDLVHAIAPQPHSELHGVNVGGPNRRGGEVERLTVVRRRRQLPQPSDGKKCDGDQHQHANDDIGHNHLTIVAHPMPRWSGGGPAPARMRDTKDVTEPSPPRALTLGRHTFEPHHTLVMAIINRTPDSFYDGGANMADADALEAVARAIDAGADIVDIGGVKAGPGDVVDELEELRRVAGFVGQVRTLHRDVIISVDTWRATVGRAACQEGADLMNDAWGGVDPQLAEVAAEFGAGLVCTHTGGATPRTRPHRVAYDDVMADILTRCLTEAERAANLGVRADGILIDPGHDFGKNTRHSLEATRRLDEMVDTGWPVLVSLSRKDFVGEALGIAVPAERLVGTLAATAVSAWLGARVYRVHDVAQTRAVLDMVASIRGDRPPALARRGLA